MLEGVLTTKKKQILKNSSPLCNNLERFLVQNNRIAIIWIFFSILSPSLNATLRRQKTNKLHSPCPSHLASQLVIQGNIRDER